VDFQWLANDLAVEFNTGFSRLNQVADMQSNDDVLRSND